MPNAFKIEDVAEDQGVAIIELSHLEQQKRKAGLVIILF